MKKVVLIIMVTLLAVALIGTAVYIFVKPDNADNSSSTPTESSQPNDSDPDEEVELTKVERENVFEIIRSNYSKITLKDVYDLANGDEQALNKMLKGVTVGDMAKSTLGLLIAFDYYSDGNWYLGAQEPTKFQRIPNLIFNYDLGSGEPIGFTAGDLTAFGGQTVISCIETQFGITVSNLLISSIPEPSSTVMKNLFFDMTVNEFYALTCGDYTYFKNFAANTEVDDFITFAFYFAGAKMFEGKDTEQIEQITKELLQGKLSEVSLNNDAQVSSVIDLAAQFMAKTPEQLVAAEALSTLFSSITVGQFESEINNLKIDNVITALEKVAVANTQNAERAQLITKLAAHAKDVLDGSVSQYTINENADFKGLIQTVLDQFTGEEDNSQTAKIIYDALKATQDAYIKVVKEYQEVAPVISQAIEQVIGSVQEQTQQYQFIQDLSQQISDIYNGIATDFTNLLNYYGEQTLAQIDAYFNNYFTNLAQYMNVRVEEFMQQTTLKEFVGYVEHFNEDSQDFSIWWYENKIKPELEKFKDMPFAEYDEQFHNGFYSRALPEELRFLLDLSVNGVLTEIEKYRTQENKWNIAGMFDDYVEGPIVDYLNQLFTQNSINSLDEKYFGSSIKNSVEQPFSGLLTFKGSDFKDLINLNASEAMLAQLDKITLADLLK